eukprot:4223626-Heterocapsa_arctica.AAC.1
MSYGHKIKEGRAKRNVSYIMFGKLGNKAHMENKDNMITYPYAQIDKVTHRGISFEENIEIDFTK